MSPGLEESCKEEEIHIAQTSTPNIHPLAFRCFEHVCFHVGSEIYAYTLDVLNLIHFRCLNIYNLFWNPKTCLISEGLSACFNLGCKYMLRVGEYVLTWDPNIRALNFRGFEHMF
jgi:hypothetical protein